MKRLVHSLNYANVVATLALFIALGGASYAAFKLPKNSVGTKQIKKGAITPAKFSRASWAALTTRQGPKGDTGATGPQGSKGDRGEPGPLLETLPSGRTEHGIYSFAGTKSGTYSPSQGYSFPLPLPSKPTPQVIGVGGSPTAQCPGSANEPRAAAGELCLYETRNDAGTLLVEPEQIGTGAFGFALFTNKLSTGTNFEFQGSWAVTAP